MNTCLLVDGTAVAYRAFFAIATLSTKAGLPTNALFGFIKMLRQLEQAWNPSHWCVTFDGGLPEERLQAHPDYKAQRAEMPDALRAQLPLLNEFLDAASIPNIRVEGQEADDVMATLVEAMRGAADVILLATSDKDLFQLVDGQVAIVSPTKRAERLGPDEVQAKTGVPPGRIVEWLALTGDTADNIPGVPGVGGKTAAKLLSEYGSLSGVWDALERLPSARIRDALREHRSVVERNLAMMSLRRNLPLPLAAEDLRRRPAAVDKVLPFLERWELDSLAAPYREPQLPW